MNTLEEDTIYNALTRDPCIQDLQLHATYVFWNDNMKRDPFMKTQVWTGKVVEDLGYDTYISIYETDSKSHQQVMIKIVHDHQDSSDEILISHPQGHEKVILDNGVHSHLARLNRYAKC